MDDTLVDDLEALSKLVVGTPEWRETAERILAAHEETVSVVARKVSRQPGLTWENHRDDIVQLVRETHWRMLEHIGAGFTFPVPFEAWEAALCVRARSAVRAWAESVEVTGISSYSGVARRRRALHELRERFEVDLGLLMSDEEVVETYNDRVHPDDDGRRKHSAQATGDDLAGVSIARGMDLAYLPSAETVERLVTDQLSTEAVTQLIAQTIEEASAANPQLGEIAKAWFSPWPEGDLLSTVEVARLVGVSASTARKALAWIRLIFIGRRVVGGGSDETSLAIARTVADAWMSDDRLGRVAEMRFSCWPANELVPVAEIARRLSRTETEVARAIVEIERLLERHLTVEQGPGGEPDPLSWAV